MKVKIEMTLDVVARAWAEEYGTGGTDDWNDGVWTGSRAARAAVAKDVRAYIRHELVDLSYAVESGLVKVVR